MARRKAGPPADDGPALGPLPDFEGETPLAVVTSLTGTSSRLGRAMHLEETVLVLAEVEVTQVAHRRAKEGLRRVQTLTALDLFEVTGDVEAKSLLTKARKHQSAAEDEAAGRAPLPGLDPDDEDDPDPLSAVIE